MQAHLALEVFERVNVLKWRKYFGREMSRKLCPTNKISRVKEIFNNCQRMMLHNAQCARKTGVHGDMQRWRVIRPLV